MTGIEFDRRSGSDEELPPRGSFGLLADRQFGLLFWGKLFGGTGAWIHGIVAAIVVYSATHSAIWVGLVSVVQFTPQIFLSPLAGQWADRGHMAFQLILGRVLCAVGSMVLALVCWIGGDPQGYAGATAVLAASLVVGVGFVVGGPAQNSIIPLIIRQGELGAATGLNSLPMTLARVAGPAVGAFVAAHLGPGPAFALAGLAQLVFVGLLILAALPEGEEHDETAADFSVRGALRYVRDDRIVLLLLLVVAAAGFASEPAITLAPTFTHVLGGGEQVVGYITGSFGLGAALGYIAYVVSIRSVSQQRITQCGILLMALGTLALAFTHSTWAVLVLFGLVGTGFMIGLTAATTLIQQRVPALLRGRVMALWSMGFVGSRPFAAALDGALTDAFSLRVPLVVTAVLLLSLMAGFRPGKLDFSGRD